MCENVLARALCSTVRMARAFKAKAARMPAVHFVRLGEVYGPCAGDLRLLLLAVAPSLFTTMINWFMALTTTCRLLTTRSEICKQRFVWPCALLLRFADVGLSTGPVRSPPAVRHL